MVVTFQEMGTSMDQEVIPKTIPNWIDGEECKALTGDTFGKLSPVSGKEICRVARSRVEDVEKAIQVARRAQAVWADSTPCLLYTSPSPRDVEESRMPSSA